MSRWIDYDAIDYRNDRLHDKSEEFLNGVIYMAQRIEEAPSIDICFCRECKKSHIDGKTTHYLYIAGREDGYEQGFNDCKNPLADAELDAAYRDGEQAGYIAGREDGYDEACMDLTDDDLGSSLDEDDCTGCFGASFNDCTECRKQEAANG